MKNNALALHAITGNALTAVNTNEKSQENFRAAYLKAILSGNKALSSSDNTIANENPDRAAAIRYIKESALKKK